MSKRGSKYLRTAAFQAAEVPPWLQKTRCLIRFTKNKEAEKKTPGCRQPRSQQDAPCCFFGTQKP